MFQCICWTHLTTCWESNANKPQTGSTLTSSVISKREDNDVILFNSVFFFFLFSQFSFDVRHDQDLTDGFLITWRSIRPGKMLNKSVDVVLKFPREHSEHLGCAFHNLLHLESLDSILGSQRGEMSPRGCAGCAVGPKTHFSFQDRPTTGVTRGYLRHSFPVIFFFLSSFYSLTP